MRIPALAFFVLASCSSGEEAKETPKPAPSKTGSADKVKPPWKVAQPEANPAEEACGDGDAKACFDAELFAEACLHGSGEGCAKQAEADEANEERWLGRACRRGHESSCPKGKKPPAIDVRDKGDGIVAERVASVYRHSVADCLALHKAKPDLSVTVRVKIGGEGIWTAHAESKNKDLERCVATELKGWAFPDVDPPGTEVAVEFGLKAEKPLLASGPDDAAIEEAISNTAILAILGSDEPTDGRFSKSTDIDQGVGLAAAIDDVRKSGDNATVGGEGSRHGGKIGTAKPDEDSKTVRGRAKFGTPMMENETLPADGVARKIRSRYLRGIKSCYEKALKDDPKLGGKVTIRITIGQTGRVIRSNVNGFDSGVDACIAGMSKKWRFGVPKTEDGEPTTATVSLPIVLKAAQ